MSLLQHRSLKASILWHSAFFMVQLPEFTQTHVHWVGDAIQPSHLLSSPSPPAINLSQHQGLFQWVGSSFQIRWPKYWSFSFSISPSGEYSGLISFRMDWLDLLAVQGTLKSFLQHYSLKASILWHSAFFIVQLSHWYMTTGKTIALTRQTFVSKVISLHFNMLSRLVSSLQMPQTHFIQTCLHPFYYLSPPSSCISFFRWVALTVSLLLESETWWWSWTLFRHHHIQLL